MGKPEYRIREVDGEYLLESRRWRAIAIFPSLDLAKRALESEADVTLDLPPMPEEPTES